MSTRAASSKRKRMDTLRVPGQEVPADQDGVNGDPGNGTPASAPNSAPPAAKRPKKRTSVPGEGRKQQEQQQEQDEEDSQSSSSAEEEVPQVTAGEKESMAAPAQAGLINPKGYKTNPPPEGRPIRVYADGVFDMFHLGHMRQLEQAKKAFPNTILVVGIPNDIETHKRKGLTVLSDKERSETLRHCKWVDEVIEDAPWILDLDFLAEHNIDYVAHDDEPYAGGDVDDIYKPVKEAGKFLVTQRTEGISTTYIITKIVRDYEKYITRQLKRGTPRQELNVSWLKKNEIDIKRHVNELRDSIKTNWSTTGQELRNEIGKYWAPSPRRPDSPAGSFFNSGANASNPNLSHLDIRRSSSPHTDFATGYSLGLMGGVRSWITTRATSARGSEVVSPAGSDSDDDLGGLQSPVEEKHDQLNAHGNSSTKT